MLKYDHYKNCGVFDLYLMFKLNLKCVLKYLKEDKIFFSLMDRSLRGGGGGLGPGIKPEPIISSKLTKHQEGLKHFGFESKL